MTMFGNESTLPDVGIHRTVTIDTHGLQSYASIIHRVVGLPDDIVHVDDSEYCLCIRAFHKADPIAVCNVVLVDAASGASEQQ